MDDYQSKPFTSQSLWRLINQWVKPAAAIAADAAELGMTSESAIDMAALEAIRLLDPNGDDELLKQMISLYLGNAGTLLQSLQQGFETGDIGAIAAASHTLKSSSNQMGALGLAELCRDVEIQARNNGYDESGQALTRILQEFNNTQAMLEACIQ